MRLVFATVFEYPHPGGLSTHVDMLSAALLRRGHEVSFATPRRISPVRLELVARAPSVLLQALGGDRGRIWSHRERLRILTQGLARLPKDQIVIAEDVLAAIAAKRAGLPCLLTVHGYLTREALSRRGMLEGSLGQRYFERMEREGYLAAGRIVTVDHRLKEHVLTVSGRGDARVQPNFIDTAWALGLPPRDDSRTALGLGQVPVILCPRRLTPKNGVHVAVAAMAYLPHAVLLVVGDGAESDSLQSQAAGLDLGDRVRFEGAKPHAGMAQYYAAADAVVVPSVPVAGVEEATSISVLEGMASGRPVVASAIGGLRELITPGENGLLVPPDDPRALAHAVREALSDAGPALGRAAQDYVARHHSADAAAEAFEDDLSAL
ncbi:MAG: glycosyltransferase family 4 protein [Thermaerobacter sp.]|nr:glycosyltransferase family 4 protein [Thermaerobacter sp.]